MQASFFDPIAAPSAPAADILRTIQPKCGLFRELKDGEVVREFRLVELIDGRILREFTDGSRGPSPVTCNRILIDDAIRYGTLVEGRT